MAEEEKKIITDSFPSNSRTRKIEQDIEEKSPTRKVEKVIVGGVKTQKRSFGKKVADIFLEDDSRSVGNYIVHDVLIPAGKAMICDIVGWGGFAEMMLFGDRRPNRGGGQSSIRRGGNAPIVNYGSYSSRPARGDVRDRGPQQRDISKVGRARHDFDEIILDTRGEAEEVLSILTDLTIDYGMASVADLYDAVGITTNFTDNKYWNYSKQE